jgi:SAM-dependent methyltransferase
VIARFLLLFVHNLRQELPVTIVGLLRVRTNMKNVIGRLLKRIRVTPYHILDSLYLPLDRENISRTKNIRLIPNESARRGGKYSYAEWAHVIGIFQTMMSLHLQKKEGNKICDIGCGTGLLAIASEPFIGRGGKYTGIDVMKNDIAFCRSHYLSSSFEFIHFDLSNAAYAPAQKDVKSEWPVDSESFDLATALSVWTHLNEEDALFYFKEISRILKPRGKAIVTFFLLDEAYKRGLEDRSTMEGRFHMTLQSTWVFDQPSYGSDAWLHPKWARVPEEAIGVTEFGLDRLISSSGMKLIELHPGNWKEVPGVFFQDILVLQKA